MSSRTNCVLAILQSHSDILAAIEARDVELARHLIAESFEEFERCWKILCRGRSRIARNMTAATETI